MVDLKGIINLIEYTDKRGGALKLVVLLPL